MAKTFTRMGEIHIVKAQAETARQAGAEVQFDKIALTCKAMTPDGRLVFRAIGKGHGQPWIVTYSTEFYPMN